MSIATEQRASPCLAVKFCGVRAAYSRFFGRMLDQQPRAWRLMVCGVDAIAIAFERERDANRAKTALVSAGINTPRALFEAGHEEVERIIAEAQQW
jgi:hypothetical protein